MAAEPKGVSGGIDVGSRFTKLIVWDNEHNRILWQKMCESGFDPAAVALKLVSETEQEYGKIPFCATGYGRKLVNRPYLSEINCHSKGVQALCPQAALIIDIGGQDSKVIVLDDTGQVRDFAMNDKCAAGTGSFFEKISLLCDLPVAGLGEKALLSTERLEISSTCVVFAESEIISLINKKHKIADILMGLHRTAASRIRNMLPGNALGRFNASTKDKRAIVLTGGVAANKAMLAALQEVLQHPVTTLKEHFFTGALGAAIYAKELLR